MNFFVWLSETGLATAIRESHSLWLYPTILTAHTIGLSLLVGFNVVIDARVLGVGRGGPLAPLAILFNIMWFGFWLNAVSGVALFIIDAPAKVENPAFLTKLGFIAAGVVLLRMQRSVFGRGEVIDHGPVSSRAKQIAILSLICWTGAITAGRLMAYFALG
jgi:hypothetical protein